jgi:hypothetical protein
MKITAQVVAGMLEKAAWTFGQAFVVAFLAVPSGSLGWDGTKMATAAGVAAVITLALAAVQSSSIPEGVGLHLDVLLRVVRSGAAAFLSFLLVEPAALLEGRVWQGALAAAGMAVVVAAKGYTATLIGSRTSAATLPKRLDGTPPVFITIPAP